MVIHPLIGIVGPCGAGKSTLASALIDLGYSARHISQDHSYAPNMWQRITKPDVLIFLDVSYENTIKRRSLDWTEKEYQEQRYRLRHAYNHADFCLDTNTLDQSGVLQMVISWLRDHRSEFESNTPG